jgi:hypothetical protein
MDIGEIVRKVDVAPPDPVSVPAGPAPSREPSEAPASPAAPLEPVGP